MLLSVFGYEAGKLGFRLVRRWNQSTQEVHEWVIRKEVPIVGRIIRKSVPNTTRMERAAAKQMTSVLRAFVNTKTCEHVVLRIVHTWFTIAQSKAKREAGRLLHKPTQGGQRPISTSVELLP